MLSLLLISHPKCALTAGVEDIVIFQQIYEIVEENYFLEMFDLFSEFELYLKVEGVNPAGSIKLKPAISMIEDAERCGHLTTGGRIIESSSGSLGIALAMVAASKGYTFTCVVDPNIAEHSLQTILALGAHVARVDQPDCNGGYLGTRLARVQTELEADPALVWLNQYANPANPAAHDAGTAAAILREFDRVDYLFVGAGTTGTLMGCVKHFRKHSPNTKIVAVDSVGSVTFGGKSAPRFIPGLGASRRSPLFRPDAADSHVQVPEADSVRACRHLAKLYGFLAGGSTGSILAAIATVRAEIPVGSRVVALSPDMGERYLRTIYSDSWVLDTYGPDALIPSFFDTYNQRLESV
jgi:cysteine synthase A